MTYKVVTKGLHKVIDSQGNLISSHTYFQKALENALNKKATTILFPDKIVIEYIPDSADNTAPSPLTILSINHGTDTI